jgi:RNase adaptor protein for sRNA GlmZ degradation
MAPPADTIHATAVALGDAGVLLMGPSGAGKSDLALRLVAAGWRLVADDRVVLARDGDSVLASAPALRAGRLEVRGVGIVAQPTAPARLALVLDLGRPPQRLPDAAAITLAGVELPCLAFDPCGPSAPERARRALASHGLGRKAGTMLPIVIISGLSGAGKSTALKALEDAGHEVVDNLPLALFDALLAGGGVGRPLALGIDSRTRALDPAALVARIAELRRAAGTPRDLRLLFLECGTDELIRRFSETRRRHPLAQDRPAVDGIAAERALLAPVKAAADLVIDTTELSVHDLRQRIAERFGGGFAPRLTVSVLSFGFASGLPRDADLVFDVRFLANPHWNAQLRPQTGQDAAVAAFVADDPLYAPALDGMAGLIATLLPGYEREGKSYLTIAVGCTGGRHRSVAVARALAARLEAGGQPVSVRHRDIAKAGSDAAVVAGGPAVTPLTDSAASGEALGR